MQAKFNFAKQPRQFLEANYDANPTSLDTAHSNVEHAVICKLQNQ